MFLISVVLISDRFNENRFSLKLNCLILVNKLSLSNIQWMSLLLLLVNFNNYYLFGGGGRILKQMNCQRGEVIKRGAELLGLLIMYSGPKGFCWQKVRINCDAMIINCCGKNLKGICDCCVGPCCFWHYLVFPGWLQVPLV